MSNKNFTDKKKVIKLLKKFQQFYIVVKNTKQTSLKKYSTKILLKFIVIPSFTRDHIHKGWDNLSENWILREIFFILFSYKNNEKKRKTISLLRNLYV